MYELRIHQYETIVEPSCTLPSACQRLQILQYTLRCFRKWQVILCDRWFYPEDKKQKQELELWVVICKSYNNGYLLVDNQFIDSNLVSLPSLLHHQLADFETLCS